jgi:hypothetical protein
MTAPTIERMSWEEKLRTLEELWDSITREGDRYESPPWHGQALKETQQRYESKSLAAPSKACPLYVSSRNANWLGGCD